MFICDETTKAYLEEWAETENRTVSNLVETLIQEAIATRQQNKAPSSGTNSGGKGRGKKGVRHE
jgi:hypothetical protein